MAETAVPIAAEERSKVHLTGLAEKFLGDAKSLTAALEKALQALHDDEYERLPRDEKRAFYGEAVRRELAKAGLGKGQLAMSGLNATETPTAVALAALAKQDAKCGAAVKAALERLRTVAIDCVACENLTLPRFKAEDDRGRVCGDLLPLAASVEKADAEKAAAAAARKKVEDEAARKKAEADAAAKKKADEEAAKKKAADEARRKIEAEVEGKRKAAEDVKRKADAEVAARKAAEEE